MSPDKIKYNTPLLRLFAFSLCFIFSILSVYTQAKPKTEFKITLQDILDSKPSSFSRLENALEHFQYDSLKMKVLENNSKAESYLEGQIYALNALGAINRNISKYEKAIELHQQAKTIAESADNTEFKIISLNMIGVAYRRMDIIKPALDYHTKALEIANAIKNPSETIRQSIAVSQNSIGNIYLALKQYDLAIAQFNKSLKIEAAANNKLGLAINYHNIGYAEEAMQNTDIALVNYQKSLDYNNAIDSDIGRVICYNSIGNIYTQKKNYKKAMPYIKDALSKALKLGDQFYIALSYINLGRLEIGLNSLASAERNLRAGLKSAETYHLKSSVAEAKKLLSELNVKKEDFESALDYYQEAVAIENTILTDRNLQYVNEIVLQFENETKNKQIKALANENEAVRSRLERNKKLFWLSMLALGIIGTVLFIIYRNRRLSQEKQILTLEQDMLRSQMNPHFIFNSLNSIKLYIINNEKENAVYYLNKFSKLIRKILIASTEKDNSLEDELETMKLYMNIENVRFSNEIDFNINVDESINIETIKVPSLILQPFLENALWHGLSSKPENKRIDLNVFQNSPDHITVEIMDNGIGRKAANDLNESKKLKRKSIGIELTKARLANFSKDFANNYELHIEDLYDNGKPSGTKVRLNIPTNSIHLKIA